jgi:hypothetical protein
VIESDHNNCELEVNLVFFWRKVLDNFFHQAFKKVRISSKIKCKKSEISELMNRRNLLNKKVDKDDNDEEEMFEIEEMIANKCQEGNRRRIMDN